MFYHIMVFQKEESMAMPAGSDQAVAHQHAQNSLDSLIPSSLTVLVVFRLVTMTGNSLFQLVL